jgi:biotin carboxyl carrier protein
MRKLRISVDGKVFEVTVEILDEGTPDEVLQAVVNPAVAGPVGSAEPPAVTEQPSEIGESGIIKSPLPGKVVSVDVNPGDSVEKGDRLLTIEAMKMYNYINAPQAGKVSSIFVALGATVEKGQTLLQIL